MRKCWKPKWKFRVKAEEILKPEELAGRLKVPDSWVYEKTRGRCRTFPGSSALGRASATGPIPCLRLGRYVRFDWTAVATWLAAPAPQNTARQYRIFRTGGTCHVVSPKPT
jgi:predicted DNA-binding transcriptional regulator AlpA